MSIQYPIIRRYLPALASLLLLLPVSRYAVGPRAQALPDDFHYQAQVLSKDNFFDEHTQSYKGEVQSDSRFTYDAIGVDDGVMVIRNAFDVRSHDGEPIFSVERQYGVDPVSGKHVAGHGDKDREGYLFAPRFLDRQDITYWHVNYDSPISLHYQGEETIDGLEVYRYESTFHTDQTDSLKHLPFVGVARGVNLDVHIQVWFEPVSGYMVKYADQATAFFYSLATGKRLSPWNRFSNTFSEKSIEEHIRIAKAERLKGEFFAIYIPILLIFLAIAWSLGVFLKSSEWRPKINRRAVIIAVLITLSCGATMTRWVYLKHTIDTRLTARFDADIDFLSQMVVDRMNAQVALLEGAKGLFDASPSVNADAWKAYVSALKLPERYPGMQGIGFAPLITDRDKVGFQERMRKEVSPLYEISPGGSRSEYVPVTYLEPSDERNRRATGYDMFSEAVRRQAMVAARDLGQPALSGRVTLVQETDQASVQAGMLLYVPVYRHGAKVDTVEQRRSALIGYVYSPFRMDNLIGALTTGRDMAVDMEIYDGTEESIVNPDQRMYSSLPRTLRAAVPRFLSDRIVPVVGRSWTFRFSSVPGYGLDSIEEEMPTIVLLAGLSFTLLMTLGIWLICHWTTPTPARRSTFVKRSPIKEIL